MLRRLVTVALWVLAVAVGAHLLHATVGLGGPAVDTFFEDWVYTVIEAGAVVLCVLRGIMVREERAAWLTTGAALALWAGGDLLWTVWLAQLDEVSYPNVSDALYISYYVLAYVGQILLLRARLRPFSASLWLDGLVAGLTLAAVCAALVVGPVLASTEGSLLEVWTTLSYPVADLLLLLLVGVAFGLTGWRPGRAWTLIGVSLVLTAIADAGWAYIEVAGTYDAGNMLTALWPASMLALAIGAWQRPARRTAGRDGFEIIAVPLVFAAISLGLLVYSQLHEMSLLAALLAVAALAAAGARGVLTFLENVTLLRRSRHEALTDALSGLGNRRRLMDDIDEALAAARAGEAQTLVFFDLDGFKGYNDGFGHNAGDALLARLGNRLEAAVTEHGAAYRLGGDEFCVLLRSRAGRDDPLVAAAAEALREQGHGFSVGASYGLVALPEDADSATVALQLADERMYADKDSRRTSSRRQARDLLIQILSEREPHLRRHMDDVADLAVAVATRMGLPAETLDEIVRAAELHDIGKIAIPDSVLHKPAPLDELEWDMMRQHTLVGERILAAAPALKPVARIIRSSHERWDGGGYPDGLAGEAIPLGARLISICDAYDAMVSDRPYRAALTAAAAIAELERCAGSHFDPEIVAEFVAALADGIAARGGEAPADAAVR